MAGRGMTDEEAKALARKLVQEAIQKSRVSARIEGVYHVHDKDLYRVAVVGPDDKEAHLGFSYTELTEEIERARQKARLFVADVLRRR